MLKALITGVDGFMGTHLTTALLAAGYEVSGIVHRPRVVKDSRFSSVHVCSLDNAAGLARATEVVQPDVVVHLAAISFVAFGNANVIYLTNVVGTYNLLKSIVDTGCKPRSVLLASSANIYGNATVEPICETVPAAPASDYAVSKVAMEYMARLWCDRLPITLVRPFNCIGVGQAQNFLLPKIIQHFKLRAPVLELGNLDVVRDFIDVRTVVECYRRLLESGLSGDVFNICSGQGHSLLEILDIMRELTGHSPAIRINPEFVRANEVHRLIGNRAKLDAAIGSVPEIGLHDTLQWMLENSP